MEYYIKIIAMLAALLVAANFVLYFVVNYKNSFSNDLEKNSLLFWGSLIPLFAIGANLENQIYVPFVTIFAVFSFIGIRNILLGSGYKKQRIKYIFLAAISLFAISITYFQQTGNIFPSAILIAMGLNLFILESLYACLFEIKKKNIYHSIILFPLVIGLYNNAAPILGQINIMFDVAGWATALLMYQLMSIVLPLMILQKRKEDEKENLALEVKRQTQALVLETSELSLRHQEASHLARENMYLLNALSHDIANPILVVSLLANQMKRFEMDEKSEDSLAKIIGSTSNIIDFINVSKGQRKLVAKKKMLELESVDIDNCLRECRSLNSMFLSKKNITYVATNTLEDQRTFLANESTFILSMLNNILNNAIKFTPDNGSVTLNIFEQDEKIIFEIQDTGDGIDENTLSDINENGFTSSQTGTAGEEGSGFGLSNVIRYVKQYNGTIKFFTNDIGTKVVMKFPLAIPEPANEFNIKDFNIKDFNPKDFDLSKIKPESPSTLQ
jgi:signal transduction histidine kinase